MAVKEHHTHLLQKQVYKVSCPVWMRGIWTTGDGEPRGQPTNQPKITRKMAIKMAPVYVLSLLFYRYNTYSPIPYGLGTISNVQFTVCLSVLHAWPNSSLQAISYLTFHGRRIPLKTSGTTNGRTTASCSNFLAFSRSAISSLSYRIHIQVHRQ